jgi:long-chain acyl-CoA synthetase
MVIGDNRPYLSALIVLEPEQWKTVARTLELDPDDPASLQSERLLKAVDEKLHDLLSEFPGFAQVRAITCCLQPWTIDNEMITPTMKLKRNRILEACADSIERMYAGH